MKIAVHSLILATLLLSAQASEINLKATNAVIEKVQERRTAREAALSKWKDSGAIGEEFKGTLLILPQAKLSLSERKEVRDLVLAENEDRQAFFREVIFVQVLPEAELPKVGEAFARERRKSAAPTHWLQDPLKQHWIQKKDLRE